jgi:hypothetical protein
MSRLQERHTDLAKLVFLIAYGTHADSQGRALRGRNRPRCGGWRKTRSGWRQVRSVASPCKRTRLGNEALEIASYVCSFLTHVRF